MKKLRIAVDADGTLYDLCTSWFQLFTDRFGREPVPLEQCVHYNPHLCLGDGGSQVPHHEEKVLYDLLHTPGLFQSLTPYAGALEALRQLHDAGHEIYIASAPAGPQSAYEKMRAFERDLPFVDRKHVFLGHHKHLLDVDVIVDDSPDVVRKFRDTVRLGIEQPWNSAEIHRSLWDFLAPSWRETDKAWAALVERVQLLSGGR